MSPTSKILIVAAYIGRLPDYFPLWLTSCRANPTIDWLIVTDADISVYDLPQNVHFRATTLAELAKRFSMASGVEVALKEPYKICDFKPIFWCLTDLAQGQWDFWGHCDIDMIFGDIRSFLTDYMLENYDKIFSVGHLTIYRNEANTNHFYLKEHPDLNWRKVFTSPEHFGFDEHIGVNRIWSRHSGRQYCNESIIADIDPHIRHMTISSSKNSRKNYQWQIFAFNNGKVLRYYIDSGKVHSESFMYIHFQKRNFNIPTQIGMSSFIVTPKGFLPMPHSALTPADLREFAGERRLSFMDVMYIARRRLSFLKSRLLTRSEAPR